jgi:enamine deaminase RidA (YjgF/YER057c/UK114 family)
MEQDSTLPEDHGEQFQLSLENIRRNLQAAHMEVKDIVKLTIYLAGPLDNERRREILSAWLGEHQPCMTLIYVAALANSKLKVELEALACTDVS